MSKMHLFHRPGTAYIYLNYGIHWILNLAALPEGTRQRNSHPGRERVPTALASKSG
jgi:hypothetical protein